MTWYDMALGNEFVITRNEVIVAWLDMMKWIDNNMTWYDMRKWNGEKRIRHDYDMTRHE